MYQRFDINIVILITSIKFYQDKFGTLSARSVNDDNKFKGW